MRTPPDPFTGPSGRSFAARGRSPRGLAYPQGRRKRAMARQMRRFESALSGLPGQLRLDSVGRAAALVQGSGWHASKLLSLLLLAGVFTVLVLLHTQDEWFVYAEDVQFNNLVHLRADDLYRASQVEGWNIFWLQPQAVRQRLLAQEWVADARVEVALPAQVTVEVQETKPVAVWMTNRSAYWLAADGAALPVTGEVDVNLPRIVDSLLEARDISAGERLAIDPQVLASALALTKALPELEGKVRYNQSVGLNFPLPKPGVWVYWGDGLNMDQKLQTLAATRELLRTSEEPAQIVDVRFVDRPYVR